MTLITIRSNSTENGIHSYYSWLSCPRKAYLNELKRKEKVPNGFLSGIDAFDIGSIWHGLLAAHYETPDFDTTRLTYKLDDGSSLDENHFESRRDAEALFLAYRAHYLRADFTKILDIESEFELVLPNFKLSGGLDLVVGLGKRDLKKMNIDGQPGVYVIDHKTRSKKEAMEYELALHNPQFAAYPKLAETKYGSEVRGMIINLGVKTKTPSFERLLIPKMATDLEWNRVTLPQLGIASRLKEEARRAIESKILPEARTNECFTYQFGGWKACNFYSNNQCDRRNKV